MKQKIKKILHKVIAELTDALTLLNDAPGQSPNKEAEMKYKNKKIVKRTDGRWFARYRAEGKIKTVYGKTQIECYEKLKKAINTLSKEINVSPKMQTYSEWVERWISIYKMKTDAPATLHKRNRLFELHIKQSLGGKTISKITALELQEFLAKFDEKPRLKEHLYTFLSDSFNKATALDIIDKNPMRAVEIPKHKMKQKRALTREEEMKIIEAMKGNEHYEYFALMIYEGLRPGEVLALRPCDIKDDYIFIEFAKDELGNYKTPKNGKTRRVPIFETFRPVANVLRGTSKKPIWNQKKGYGGHYLELLGKKLGISRLTPYIFRHTFCTRCVENGVGIEQVMEWAGHSSIEVTRKYYVHINDEFEQLNISKNNNNKIN